jgi:branched-chain amino acid transport system permease protein
MGTEVMTTTIWSGLTIGAIYALVASGFTLSLIPSGVFNFAQGALVVGGAYLTYHWFAELGLSVGVALLLNALAGVVAGILCELIAVRPLRLRGVMAGDPTELITTIGMATAITGAIGIVWGFVPLRVPFHGPTKTVHFLGVNAAPVEIFVVAMAVVAAVACSIWFRHARVGQACLAVAEDRGAAMLRGINVDFLSIGGFACAGLLAGVAGMAIGPITYAVPTLGQSLALGGFVALALGGQGSFVGGLVGGFFVGLVSSFAVRYIGASYGDIFVFVLLLGTLAFRPQGLGGVRESRNV